MGSLLGCGSTTNLLSVSMENVIHSIHVPAGHSSTTESSRHVEIVKDEESIITHVAVAGRKLTFM